MSEPVRSEFHHKDWPATYRLSPPPPPSRLFRLYVILRKLVRRRQESQEVKTLNKRIANRDQALEELRQKMDRKVSELEYALERREEDIKALVDLEIPKLKRELEVEQEYSRHLAVLVKKKLIFEEAQIAVDNKRIADAEAPSPENQQMRQLLRGDRT